MSELKHREIWRGEYRGIQFEINRFDSFCKDMFENGWTYYLYINLFMFPEERRQSMRTRVYYTAFGTIMETPVDNPLNKLDWHGGLTWISEETTKGSPFIVIKAGCDYQHLWDEGNCYTKETVLQDVKRCIDSLHRYIPPIKTNKELWEEFRAKFPGEKAGDHRTFDIDGNPIDFKWD